MLGLSGVLSRGEGRGGASIEENDSGGFSYKGRDLSDAWAISACVHVCRLVCIRDG